MVSRIHNSVSKESEVYLRLIVDDEFVQFYNKKELLIIQFFEKKGNHFYNFSTEFIEPIESKTNFFYFITGKINKLNNSGL